MAYSKSELEKLWKQANPDLAAGAPIMAAIALAESKGKPGEVNSIGACGLWQIHPYEADCTDPLVNAQQAGSKYRTQRLKAWETYTNGAYKQYLSDGKGLTEIIPGESKVPLVGALGKFFQGQGEGVGEAFGKANPLGGVEGAIGGVTGLVSGLGSVVGFLDKREGWIRVLKTVGGVGVLALAIDELVKGKPVIQQVKSVAK